MKVMTTYGSMEEIRYSLFVEEQNNCALCKSELETIYSLNEDKTKIKEEAECKKCKMRARSQFFYVH